MSEIFLIELCERHCDVTAVHGHSKFLGHNRQRQFFVYISCCLSSAISVVCLKIQISLNNYLNTLYRGCQSLMKNYLTSTFFVPEIRQRLMTSGLANQSSPTLTTPKCIISKNYLQIIFVAFVCKRTLPYSKEPICNQKNPSEDA